MTQNPLKLYSEAIQAYKAGDKERASTLLSQSLGSEKVLPVVQNSLDTLINPSAPLSFAMLRQMLSVERR